MRISWILLFSCAGLLTACSIRPANEEPLRLRVLTYNIHHGRGTDGVIDLKRQAEVIGRAEPDLIALQEVDINTNRSGGTDQASELGGPYAMMYYPAMQYDGGHYGNAVISSIEVTSFGGSALPSKAGHEPRSIAAMVLRPWPNHGNLIGFCGTHLCHKSEATRLNQCKLINEGVDAAGLPAVLAGDFNFTPGSAPYQSMIDAGWVDTAAAFGDPQPTAPSDDPRVRIDYVFVRPASAWRVRNVRVLNEPIASDHLPLLVELEYIGPPEPYVEPLGVSAR